ncbi:MAG: hypothetical protein IJN03_00120 [Bacilli bacterium]|nr:hypothetical protein [Bacilli bacterium]
MKKLLILGCILVLLTGCTNLKDNSVEDIISESLASRVDSTNVNRKGYRYYLPRGLKVIDSTDYNEVFKDTKYKYYLYVDIISKYNKISEEYKINNNSFISRNIKNGEKRGYLEVNEYENSKYLIEIMYNYAKIEVMVDENDINKVIAYAVGILSSITYNDSVIENLMGDDVLNFMEEEFNIFETVSSDSNYLQYEEEYKYVEEDIPDTDLVN